MQLLQILFQISKDFLKKSLEIVGTMLSFIWPALFHLKIKGDKMVDRDRK